MYPYLITDQAVTIVIDGTPSVISNDHPNFRLVKEAIRDEAWDEISDLIDVANAVEAFADGIVEVIDGEVYYDGDVVRTSVADKILELMREGFDITPLANFLARVEENPLSTAREELYDFCEANGFAIDEDGMIVAYKAVRGNYTDIHSGTTSTRVGTWVEMPRNKVDVDRRRECSYGLHFAAWEYAKSFGGFDDNNESSRGNKMLLIKVDPADVVAIPQDYHNQKGRCCKYYVEADITGRGQLKARTFRAGQDY